MKTKFYFIAALVVVMCSCAKKEKAQDITEEVTDSLEVVAPDMHTANISLDYMGYYSGVTPCADCEGIETSISLEDEKNYVLKTKYLGKKETKVNEQRGLYTWNDTGNTITLEGIENGPTQYFVGENTLTQLDLEGNKIEGNLAPLYVLKKSEAPNVNQNTTSSNATAAKSESKSYAITGTKWQLVELNGKPVENKNKSAKEMFLQLNAENRYAAFAGCNNMMGGYELKEDALRIKFTKGASTMMACPDMTIEQEFAEMIEKVDNYSLNGENMSLNKARMAPLARFKAIK
ncbi:MAG: copper resistance protein NlpE N-terminal domain-containing protein [Flavobacterium sp.]|nr:copper resistance protein NlpE N-terminal domain-containing protein [Flavobacterium sp.]